jgi:hypothetical protein
MWWAALLFPLRCDGTPPPIDVLLGPAAWALQFTPRVAVVEEAVVMELQASVRLFGGRRALRDRIAGAVAELGASALAWAPNSLAALAFGRAAHEGLHNGAQPALAERLDALPLHALSATQPHRSTLAQLGCATLGAVRKLPRGGIARRFDRSLLEALDRAYGLRPEAHDWITLPPRFEARLELPLRVEAAAALLFGARRCWRGVRLADGAAGRGQRLHVALGADAACARCRRRRPDRAHPLRRCAAQPSAGCWRKSSRASRWRRRWASWCCRPSTWWRWRRPAPRCCPMSGSLASHWRGCSSASPRAWAPSACCGRRWSTTIGWNGRNAGSRQPTRWPMGELPRRRR